MELTLRDLKKAMDMFYYDILHNFDLTLGSKVLL